jgi:hypothetical protein
MLSNASNGKPKNDPVIKPKDPLWRHYFSGVGGYGTCTGFARALDRTFLMFANYYNNYGSKNNGLGQSLRVFVERSTW